MGIPGKREIGQELYFKRLEPKKNMRRFYALTVRIDLFGSVVLVRRWGRIGIKTGKGHVAETVFDTAADAWEALGAWKDAKERGGYVAIADQVRG